MLMILKKLHKTSNFLTKFTLILVFIKKLKILIPKISQIYVKKITLNELNYPPSSFSNISTKYKFKLIIFELYKNNKTVKVTKKSSLWVKKSLKNLLKMYI